MIDTHAHLEYEGKFKADIDSVIKRAQEAGVTRIINIGGSLERNQEAIAIAAKYPDVWGAPGIFPVDYNDDAALERMIVELKKQALSSKKVVGIGECGFEPDLDFAKQSSMFLKQLALAVELKKSLIVHIRERYKEALELFNQPDIISQLDQIKWVIHSFTDKGMAPGEAVRVSQEFIKLGGYISVNGIITFKKTEELAKAVEAIPNDRLLLETDCPFLAPVPHRGERNEPWMVKFIAQRVAEIKRVSIDEIEKMTDGNACRFFEIS